jgi:glycosyltransferase involved in cell wall biosynthesis
MVPLSLQGQTRIVGVGSLLPVKRWDRLLLAGLRPKRAGLDFFMQIAGDGRLRSTLQKQAQDFGLVDRVQFIGHTDDTPAFLANATFLAHTSDSEGCPNVVMEAMACGRAVVATDVGDIPDLVENGETGFVVRCGRNSCATYGHSDWGSRSVRPHGKGRPSEERAGIRIRPPCLEDPGCLPGGGLE